MKPRAENRCDSDQCRPGKTGPLLVALCLLAYLPGLFSIPPVDRDESRFAQASRQVMTSASTGDARGVVVPHIQDRPRLNKPPLIYWLQAVPASIADREAAGADPRLQRIGWYRLPSVLCAILAVLATWRAGCTLHRPREGAVAAVMLAVCPIVLWDAHQARADQLLLACTAGALWAMASVWRTVREGGRVTLGQSLALWSCVGAGVLAKGPITPMVVLLALVALLLLGAGWRLVRATRPLLGLGVVLAMVLPWVVAVGSIVGWGEYASIVIDETLGRAGGAKEGHWGPPGYHLVLLAVLFFPGSLVTLAAAVRAWRRVRRRRRFVWRAPEALLLAWVVPSWIVFELVATKLPHYTMVLYPAIALLSARTLVVLARAGRAVDRVGVAVWVGIGVVIALAPSALVAWFRPEGWASFSVAAGALLGVAGAGFVWSGGRRARCGRLMPALTDGVVAALLIGAGVCGGVLPGVGALWPSSAAASAIAALDPAGERPLARSGYHEDSLIFLTRGRIERVPGRRLGAWLAEHPAGLAVVRTGPLGDENSATPENARTLATVSGFNYSKGGYAVLTIVTNAPQAPATMPRPGEPSPARRPTP